MSTFHKYFIERTNPGAGEEDNYMPGSYDATNDYSWQPLPRIYVKLPAQIVDSDYGMDNGEVLFDIETNVPDVTTLECSIDVLPFSTIQNPNSSGQVLYSGLTPGARIFHVRYTLPDGQNYVLRVPFQIYEVGGYAVKYSHLWDDAVDPTKQWNIQICQQGFDGDPIEVCAAGENAFIEWGVGGGHDIYSQTVLPSRCTMNLMVENEDVDFSDIFNAKPFAYQVNIYFDGDLHWRGWLTGDGYAYPLKDFPYAVTLVAVDGFAVLDSKYASYFHRSVGRMQWNHDNISLSKILWNIKREMRFLNNGEPTLDFIYLHTPYTPSPEDSGLSSFECQTLNLNDIIENDEVTLLDLLQRILQPQMCRIVAYGGNFYLHPIRQYESNGPQDWWKSLAANGNLGPITISGLLPSVGGISDSPSVSYKWRENNQIVSFTNTISRAILRYQHDLPSTVINGPIIPEEVEPDLRYTSNNLKEWYSFWSDSSVIPYPISNDLMFLRHMANQGIAITGYVNTDPEIPWFGSEPVDILRIVDLETRVSIKFQSTHLEFATGEKFYFSLLCAGFYYNVVTNTWIDIDSATSYNDLMNEIDPAEGITEPGQKSHSWITPALPASIVLNEKISIRFRSSNSLTIDPAIYIDDIQVELQWYYVDSAGNDHVVKVKSEIDIESANSSDQERNDQIVYPCSYLSKAGNNFVSTFYPVTGGLFLGARIEYMESIFNPGDTFELSEMLADQIAEFYSQKRKIITGNSTISMVMKFLLR